MSSSCDLTDSSLPGSYVHEISQAKILEWLAISFCIQRPENNLKILLSKLCACMLSHFNCVCLRCYRPVHQAPLSMGFSRQEYWSGLPFAAPGDFPNPGTELETHVSCILQTSCCFCFFFTVSITLEAQVSKWWSLFKQTMECDSTATNKEVGLYIDDSMCKA